MMENIDRFTRSRWLFEDKFKILQNSKILICGAGGVGGICTDALARCGIGKIVLIDKDTFDITNQNRQIYSQAVGAKKVDEFSKRYENVTGICEFITPEFVGNFDFSEFDLVIDAIDDVKAKVALALKISHKLISSMGGAKRIDATQVKIADIFKTSNDPFARKIRTELKKAGFKGKFDVVFSTEEPKCKELGSFMGVTAVFGLHLASLAVRKLLEKSSYN